MRIHPATFVVALLPAVLVAVAGAQSIAFDPEKPTGGDEIEITVAAVLGPCAIGITSVEFGDGVISIIVDEGCVCGLAPPPYLQSFTATVGPLEPRTYLVQFFTTFASCPVSPPLNLLVSASLVVTQVPYEIVVEPAAPTTDDEVTLTVRSQCPALFATAVLDGVLIRLLQLPDVLAAPCFSTLEYESPFALGALGAGEYAVLLLAQSEVGPPVLHLTAGFEVVRAPSSQLLLRGGRFKVTAEWTTPGGASGPALALPLTDESGAMWFFDEANLELMIKVLDGCFWNASYWIFAAGLTDVGVTITVEDTLTGDRRAYVSPQGVAFQPILDVDAFPCL